MLKVKALQRGRRQMTAFLLSINKDYEAMVKKDEDLSKDDASNDDA